MLQKKRDKLLEYNVNGQISDEDFLEMNRSCADKIKKSKRPNFKIRTTNAFKG